MLDALQSNTVLNVDNNPQTLKATHGTGVFANVKNIRIADVKGFPNSVQFTIPGVSAAPTP